MKRNYCKKGRCPHDCEVRAVQGCNQECEHHSWYEETEDKDRLNKTIKNLVEALADLLPFAPVMLDSSKTCPSCGRDYFGDEAEMAECDSDDCPGVCARATVANAKGA